MHFSCGRRGFLWNCVDPALFSSPKKPCKCEFLFDIGEFLLEISPYCNGAWKKPGKRHWQWSRVWIHTAQERTNHSTAEALNTLALLSAITIKVWLFWLLIIWTILNVSDINFSHCCLVLRAFYPFLNLLDVHKISSKTNKWREQNGPSEDQAFERVVETLPGLSN